MFPHSLFARAQSPWDSRRAHPRGAVQRRAAGGARAQPRGGPAGHADAGQGPSLAGGSRTTGGRCSTPIAASSSAIDEGRAITPAAEWLIDNYHLVEKQIREIRADLPPGYYRQLPKLADRAVRRLSAGVRHGLGVRRPHRQPVRSGDAAPLRARLPAGAAADDRRTVGGRDHAAHRAGRKSAAARRADRATAAPRAQEADASGRPAAGRRRARRASRVPVVLAASCTRRRLPDAFAVQLVHRLRDQDPRDHAGAGVARRAAGGAGHDGRRGRARRAPAAGRGERHGAQHHHQHAPDLRRRLDRTVRERQPGRRRAARRTAASSDMDFPTRNLYRSAIEELARGLGPHRAGGRARRAVAAQPRRANAAADADERARRSRLSSDRRRTAATSRARSASARRCATWLGAPEPRARHRRSMSAPSRRHRGRSWRCRCCARWRRGHRRRCAGPARRAGRSRPSTWRSRWSTARVDARLRRDACCRRWSCATACPRACARSSRCRRC